ncbi:CLUMA_CG021120, isoform A [Clunio marinus]|uniref:CLUMA_CG021120, isoform A n=1 Tax=Clunio marinus TaxID=568069 RepID=A0A1J1J6Y7_9DIPT|nr:CLUMA_CG021120, isoform A [Clunio marinus]
MKGVLKAGTTRQSKTVLKSTSMDVRYSQHRIILGSSTSEFLETQLLQNQKWLKEEIQKEVN